jgi:hypothetical protein
MTPETANALAEMFRIAYRQFGGQQVLVAAPDAQTIDQQVSGDDDGEPSETE